MQVRYYLHRHVLRTGLVVSATCVAVDGAKAGACALIEREGAPRAARAVRAVLATATPTPLLAVALVAELSL